MSELSISIVIPSYKRVESVERLINSICQQSEQPVEMIVIDQNNFDLRTKLRLDSQSSIGFIKQNHPNVSVARNSGALASKGEYVLFLDDDIILNDKDFLKKSKHILNQHTQIKCLCPYIMQEDFSKPRLFYQYPANFIEFDKNDRSLVQIKEAASLAIFFEKKFFLKTGGFDPQLFEFAGTSEDQELFFRMYRNKLKVFAHREIVAYHDHQTKGGCELRTSEYWETRKKCTRSWVLIKYIQNNGKGSLSILDKIKLARSSFFNSNLIKRYPGDLVREYKLLIKSMTEAKSFYLRKNHVYRNGKKINHLTQIDEQK